MIIIEGTDGVGKTTLAKKLITYRSNKLRMPPVYRHLGFLPGNWDYYYDYVNRMDHHIVQDRFFLSEWVYGRVIRGGTPLSKEKIRDLFSDLINVGGLTVIVTAESSLLEMRWKDHVDDKFDLSQVLAVNEEFMCMPALDFCPPWPSMLRIHLSKHHPFPDQTDIKCILENWHDKDYC